MLKHSKPFSIPRPSSLNHGKRPLRGPTVGAAPRTRLISEHIRRHLGPIHQVWHEPASRPLHIDICHLAPSKERPCHVLITSGMSERPMHTPLGLGAFRYAELVLLLSRRWPLHAAARRSEKHAWPIRLIKQLARFPHAHDTWLGWFHTVQNGQPAERYHHSVAFTSALIAPPLLLPKEFRRLEAPGGDTIHFHSVIPLCPEELALKLAGGTEWLCGLFDRAGVTELVNPRRANVCCKKPRRLAGVSGVEQAWAAEIQRRLTELERGEVKTIPWEEVRRRILARIDET